LAAGDFPDVSPLPAPTETPVPGVTVTPPAKTITATLSSLSAVATPTTFESPVVEIRPTSQIIVADAYTGAYHYRFTYPTEEWSVEMTKWPGGSDAPELVHRTIENCRMRLRDGARDSSSDQIVVEKPFAGIPWFIVHEPQYYPNDFTYVLPQPDKGISFFIRVEVPEGATDEVKAACQLAAEAVMDTFSLVQQ
jgi:hypothetical protein